MADGTSNTLRSFPRANIGFTRCWPYDVRKSAIADLRWESRAAESELVVLDPAFAGMNGMGFAGAAKGEATWLWPESQMWAFRLIKSQC